MAMQLREEKKGTGDERTLSEKVSVQLLLVGEARKGSRAVQLHDGELLGDHKGVHGCCCCCCLARLCRGSSQNHNKGMKE